MKRYDNALDVFALSASYPTKAWALALATQKTALAYLHKKATKTELLLLLKLATDLGYLEEPVHEYYTKLLNKR